MALNKRSLALAALAGTVLLFPALPAQTMLLYAIVAQPVSGHTGGHAPAAQGYLGIMFHDVSDSAVSAQHLKDRRGAEIVMVDHDGPAGKSGLREHDVVLSLNGMAVESEEQLRRLLHDMPPGRTISLSICRDGSERTVNATLSTREEVDRQARLQHWTVPEPPDDADAAVPDSTPSKNTSGFGHSFMSNHLLPLLPVYTGATVDAMGPQLADYFGVKDGKALLVHAVEGNSPAAEAGLHAGDVITRVNGARVTTEKDWTHSLRENRGRSITLTIVRERHEQMLTLIADGRKRSSMEVPAELDGLTRTMLR